MDNRPTFTSSEFRLFMRHNGIKHITVSPYHLSPNRLAERSVQTFKSAMIKIKEGSDRERVCTFLTKHRCTPHSTTGLSPAELMFGRNIRTRVDLLHPNLHDYVCKKQAAQKTQCDKHDVDRYISVGDDVFVCNLSFHSEKWLPGIVIECTSFLSFKVRTATHGIVCRHLNQIRTPVHYCTEGLTTDLPVSICEESIVPQEFRSILPDNAPSKADEIVENQGKPHSQQDISEEQIVDSSQEYGKECESNQIGGRREVEQTDSTRIQNYLTRSGRIIKQP